MTLLLKNEKTHFTDVMDVTLAAGHLWVAETTATIDLEKLSESQNLGNTQNILSHVTSSNKFIQMVFN